jgi:putative oxidoreductase
MTASADISRPAPLPTLPCYVAAAPTGMITQGGEDVTQIDSEAKPQSKLLFPALESFYAVAIPLAWPIIRIAVGWNLLVHGWGKVTRGPSAYVRAFVEQGFDPALPWVWAALIIEFVGGIALILGLFTRFFAAAAAVEMLVITMLYWKTGFSWLNRGYEYTLLWGLVCFAIALRGGGPYSVDRKIGVEL